ncbi:MAG: RHS repeat-associated core domain-containing protein, partial [Acidobacteriota bacterium]
KLASGPLAAFEENNINELNELGPELRRAMGFQALPFSEPATGLVFARERWYDPGTGSFLSPDPMGYRDSPNLYAFAGGDPVNGRDPTGEGKIWDWVKGEVEEKAGNAVAVLEAGVGCSKALLRPDLIATEKITDAYGRVKRVAQAYERGGVSWATDQYVIEEKAFLKTVPFVRTYFAAKEVPDAAKKGRFQKGLQTGRTAISAASDLALLYAAASGFRAVTTTSSAIVVETEANAIPATTPLNGGATPLNVGEVMSYREYLSRRTSGSNLRGHHIPQSARLQELGLEPLDGTVVVMENRLTGGAGEKLGHTGTRTYGVGGSRAAAAERGQPLTVSEGRDLLDPPVMRLGDEVAQMIRDLNRKIYPDHY